MLWFALMLTSWSTSPYWPDADGYTSHIAESRWVAHPPGYPFFVALGRLFAAAGAPSYLAVQLASVLLTLAGMVSMAGLLRDRCPSGTRGYLLAACLLSWIPLLIAKTGTSHAADLFTVPLLLLAALNPGLSGRNVMPFILLALAIILVAGFRLNSALMQIPMLCVVLLWNWRNWRIWAAFLLAATLIVALQFGVIAASGGWESFSRYSKSMAEDNRLASILLTGIHRNTILNSFRSLLWFGIACGPLLLFARWFSPKLLKDRSFLLGSLSMGTALGVTTFYLCTHPGYLAPALPGFFLCTARLWSTVAEPLRLRWIPLAAAAFCVLVFVLLVPIDKPSKPAEAIANGVLLQYGHSSARQSLFHTTTEWLVISGFSNYIAPKRIEDLIRQGRLDPKYAP